jgi:hypothetical protein
MAMLALGVLGAAGWLWRNGTSLGGFSWCLRRRPCNTRCAWRCRCWLDGLEGCLSAQSFISPHPPMRTCLRNIAIYATSSLYTVRVRPAVDHFSSIAAGTCGHPFIVFPPSARASSPIEGEPKAKRYRTGPPWLALRRLAVEGATLFWLPLHASRAHGGRSARLSWLHWSSTVPRTPCAASRGADIRLHRLPIGAIIEPTSVHTLRQAALLVKRWRSLPVPFEASHCQALLRGRPYRLGACFLFSRRSQSGQPLRS